MGFGHPPRIVGFCVEKCSHGGFRQYRRYWVFCQRDHETDKPDAIVKSADYLKIDLLQLNLGFITYF